MKKTVQCAKALLCHVCVSFVCVSFVCDVLNRQRQVQGGPGAGGGAAAADQQAGGDQRLPGGRCGVRTTEVRF